MPREAAHVAAAIYAKARLTIGFDPMMLRATMSFVVFVMAFTADRWLKAMVSRRLCGWMLPLTCGLALTHARHASRSYRNRFHLGALSACAIAVASLAPAAAAVAYAAALAGATSNGIDQVVSAGVVNTFSFRNRVAFNLADIEIVGGVLVGLLVTVN